MRRPLDPRVYLLPAIATFCGLGGVPAADAPAPSGGLETEPRFLGSVRQLIYEGKRSGEGYFSPDGKDLIFQSEREPGNPFFQIYILSLETGDCHRVSPGKGKTTCAFFRPGTDEVLFASTHHDPELEAKTQAELEMRASGKKKRYSWDYDEAMDIFVSRRDGTGLRRLTDVRGYDAEGAFSPDGSRIVFCSLRSAFPAEGLSAAERRHLETDPSWFGEIWTMAADGSDQRRLTDVPGYDGGPFFSPDGKGIIWRRFDEKGETAEIWTMATDGADQRRITTFGAMSWAPYWHPSMSYAIFASNKLGFSNFELYMVDGSGRGEPVRVTTTDGFDGLPVFSPDGTKLCWTSSRTPDGAAQLFLADWDHAAALEALGLGKSSHGASDAAGPAAPALAGFVPEIARRDLQAQVEHLASDALEGRLAGSPGARAASEYIARRLEAAGLEPAGDGGTFFQEIEFRSGVRLVDGKNRLAIHAAGAPPRDLRVEEDFRPLAFSSNEAVEGEVVFAGYGLVAPGQGGSGQDSYAGLDVAGKVVLALRYVPEGVDPKTRQELNRYAGLRYKVLMARERGARGILFVTGPSSPGAGELASMQFEAGVAGSGIVAATITGEAAAAILAPSGKNLASLQSALDKGDPHAAAGFVVPGVEVRLETGLEHLKRTDRNVLGRIPPGPGGDGCVLVGAHYDHIGRGEAGSLAGKGEEGDIHNGADDNASGVSVVLEIAEALAAERKRDPSSFRRGAIFAFWTGEEIGVVGSSWFAEKPTVSLDRVAAYVNFDMVGRLRENRLILQGLGSADSWRRLVERHNVRWGFQLALQDDPYLPTDATPLYTHGVPVLNFFTGGHEEYHRPGDDPATLDYAGMERIAGFARGAIADLLRSPEAPKYAKVERTSGGGPGREQLRTYLGTIPDYSGEVDGLKLSGVRPGGPADKAGLQAGDVIVELGGQKIANIYDYTYALDAAKIGEPTPVVVLRGGERVSLTITPEARK